MTPVRPRRHGTDGARRGTALSAAALALLVAVGAVAGCVTRSPAEREALLQARSQALIDSGNVAYRNHDYGLAARRYAAATLVKKDDPAAWFGFGMALTRLGRDEEARAAYARARDLATAARQRNAAAQPAQR